LKKRTVNTIPERVEVRVNAAGLLLDKFEQVVERCAVEELPVEKYARNLLAITHILWRIGIEQQHVGNFTDCDRSG